MMITYNILSILKDDLLAQLIEVLRIINPSYFPQRGGPKQPMAIQIVETDRPALPPTLYPRIIIHSEARRKEDYCFLGAAEKGTRAYHPSSCNLSVSERRPDIACHSLFGRPALHCLIQDDNEDYPGAL